MSVKLTMKRMQGYATPKKAAKLNVALVSRLKMFGKVAKDKACGCYSLLHQHCQHYHTPSLQQKRGYSLQPVD